jgi:hypothetical protein
MDDEGSKWTLRRKKDLVEGRERKLRVRRDR